MAGVGATPSPAYDRSKEVKEFDDTKIGVKGLSDSGISNIPRIFHHPPESLSHLKSSPPSLQIPVIDLSNINSINNRPKIVQETRDAAKTWGFFQVVNHGVPLYLLENTIAATKAFHEQPIELKEKHYLREEKKGFMYASNNDLYRSKAASWHDYMHVWMAPEAAPVDEIPDICRREVVEWDLHANKVGEMVAGLLDEGLGLEVGKLKGLGYLDSRVWVGIYYPFCPQPDLTVGLSHHTDPGVLTVLLPNQVAGLQVKHEEEWVAVNPIHGALIVNIGDFLEIISNGEYKSVQHRVVANSTKEARISVVEFFNIGEGDGSEQFGPLPDLLSPENPSLFRTFTRQEFNDNFYTKGLDSKSLIEKVRL